MTQAAEPGTVIGDQCFVADHCVDAPLSCLVGFAAASRDVEPAPQYLGGIPLLTRTGFGPYDQMQVIAHDRVGVDSNRKRLGQRLKSLFDQRLR